MSQELVLPIHALVEELRLLRKTIEERFPAQPFGTDKELLGNVKAYAHKAVADLERRERQTFRSDASVCLNCGSLMIPVGSCERCPNCAETSGCG